MRYLILVLALTAVSCGDNPIMPTPPPQTVGKPEVQGPWTYDPGCNPQLPPPRHCAT